jgi:hypothetical protein
MFDSPITAEIRTVKGVVIDDGDHQLRRIRLQLERTFSPEIAQGLGSSAQVALDELEGRGLEKAVMGIGAIKAKLEIKSEGKGTATIGDVTGIKAVGIVHKAGGRDEGDGEAHPLIRLEFEFPFDEAAWTFLGRTLRDTVSCKLTRSQLELPGTGSNGGGKPGRKKSKAAAAKTPAADPQSAASPEEAEDLRALALDDEDPEITEPGQLGVH